MKKLLFVVAVATIGLTTSCTKIALLAKQRLLQFQAEQLAMVNQLKNVKH
jgi:hypothetical protein